MSKGRLSRLSSNRELGVGCCHRKYFSWSPVIVGALVGLGIVFLLNLFGMAIGLSAFAAETTAGATTLAVGGFIGLVIGTIFAMGSLGLVAGYLGGLKHTHFIDEEDHVCNYGCLYGFTAWALALLLSIALSGQVGAFVKHTTQALTNPTAVVETMPYMTDNTQARRPVEVRRVDQDEAAKTLAMTCFVAFVLFFIGAISASYAGHVGFERALNKNDFMT